MRKKKLLSLVIATTMTFVALTGCGANNKEAAGENSTAPNTATTEVAPSDDAVATDASASAGFEEGATIGISLPWLGTQNWKEAETMFKDQLEAAGFKAIIQAADQKVPQQQQQLPIPYGGTVIHVMPAQGFMNQYNILWHQHQMALRELAMLRGDGVERPMESENNYPGKFL